MSSVAVVTWTVMMAATMTITRGGSRHGAAAAVVWVSAVAVMAVPAAPSGIGSTVGLPILWTHTNN